MTQEIRTYVDACEVCRAAKPATENNKAQMGSFRDPKYPWRVIATDFVGPLPRSKSGNAWILTVVDTHSKYTLAFPLKKATGETLIKKLKEEVFFVYGVPQKIICDNGSQYTCKMFDEFLESFHIEKQTTSAYTPRQNPSEAYNKVIGTALKMFITDKKHDNWDANLKEILCAINTATNTQTKKSPHEMLYAFPLLSDGSYHKLVADINERDSAELPEKLSTLWEDARVAMRAAHVQAARQYNKTANESIAYEKDEIVWKKNTVLSKKSEKRSHKLMKRHVKAIVLEKLGHNRYILGDPKTKKPIGTFSSEMMAKARQPPQTDQP